LAKGAVFLLQLVAGGGDLICQTIYLLLNGLKLFTGLAFLSMSPANFFLGQVQVFIDLCQTFLQAFFIINGGLINVFVLGN